MAPGRSRSRVAVNDNDENGGTTRVTRAKAAALTTDDNTSSGHIKKALQSKKSGTNALPGVTGLQRKRAALGDVSNVIKSEPIDVKDVKKALGSSKVGLVSKTSQNAGVQKLSRTNSSRTALGAKDNNKKAAGELKRPASGSGLGNVAKKRATSPEGSTRPVTQDVPQSVVSPAASSKATSQQENNLKQEATGLDKVEEAAEEAVGSQSELKYQPEEIQDGLPEGVPDLDADDYDDPLMVSEYVVDVFEYLAELELATLPNPNYMEHQDQLEWKMRGILVDWLIEVHARFHLLPETLFLTVNIIDRFLSAKVVQLERLQLVGVTAMFIASKYEEVLSPHVANFRHVTDDGFTEEEILSAERYILAALNYDLSYPNPMNFLRRISKADNYDIQTRTLGKYLMEISLLDDSFMSHPPSKIAAASMYLARMILDRGEWDATLAHYSGYSEEEIQDIFKLMIEYLAGPVKHDAFFKKYASKKFLKASILTRAWAKKNAAVLLDSDFSESR
ncbi:MAG: G2/mitotic-specific cyclin [Vezdaea aestivalis]|nr:MAG: G2/mitotic-specific cyclin [Vezdaea aestivalis]